MNTQNASNQLIDVLRANTQNASNQLIDVVAGDLHFFSHQCFFFSAMDQMMEEKHAETQLFSPSF